LSILYDFIILSMIVPYALKLLSGETTLVTK
jgi:hypothetical protein